MRGRATTAFMGGFLIGAVAPFAISIFAMLVSFDTGVKLATILAPATLMADRWPDALIPLANGLLYGCIACGIAILPVLKNR